jgi:hypothetical protein
VADLAETRKAVQYSHLGASHLFAPVSIETTGAFGTETLLFMKQISHRLRMRTGEVLSRQFLIQRLSVAVQRGNAMSILGSLQHFSIFDDNP